MSPKTKQQAIDALNGMATIVRAEMVEQGIYISEEIVDPDRADAICGGRKACAIGSLWLGGGIKPDILEGPSGEIWDVRLPGTEQSDRNDFLHPRHGLRVAYNALNESAEAYMERHNPSLDTQFDAPIERLFEGGDVQKDDLLKIIRSAKERIRRSK